MTKKYIVVDYMMGEQIIIFPPAIYHKDIAGDMKVISAGFINITYEYKPSFNRHVPGECTMNVHCFGESRSLKIGCRPEEDKILAKILLRGD